MSSVELSPPCSEDVANRIEWSFFEKLIQLMVLDIQGSNQTMFDPEIATVADSYDEQGELNFCMGNLSKDAICNFFQAHKCGELCQLLKIDNQKLEIAEQ